MKKISVMIITLILILALSANAWGISFGARAAGMGGAFTAVADDCSAVYWNPAGITQLKVLTITPGVGSLGSEEELQKFTEAMMDPTFPPALPEELNLGFSGYLGVTTKFFGANAFIDSNVLVTKVLPLYKTFMDVNGFGIGTLAIPFGSLAIGGNVKLVQSQYNILAIPAAAYEDPAVIAGNPDYQAQLTDPNNNYTVSAKGNGLAFDVGVLYSVSDHLKLGFSGRNIFSAVTWSGKKTKYQYNLVTQEFDVQSTENIDGKESLPSTYTIGAALRPNGSTLIAGDIEMITNPIDASFNQTRYHVGLEQTALWKTVALRLGAFSNPGEPIGLSAGVGFKLGPILVDAAMNTVDQSSGFYLTGGFKF